MLTIFIEQIKRLQKNSSTDHEFSVFWVPRRTLVCNKILEEAGVLGDISVEELPLYFIPLEQDVLSMELGDSLGDLYLVSAVGHLKQIKERGLMKAAQRPDFYLSSCPCPYAFPENTRIISSYHRER